MRMCQFLLYLYVYDVTLKSLITSQYEMAKKGIGWDVSNAMSDFERFAVTSLIAEDYKREAELLDTTNTK